MRANQVTCRGIVVWHFLGKTREFHMRALEKLGFCGSSRSKQNQTLLFLRAPLFKVSLFIQSILLCFAQGLTWTESPESGPRSFGSCPGHPELPVPWEVGYRALDVNREGRGMVARQACKGSPNSVFPEHLVLKQGPPMELKRFPRSSSFHFRGDIV